MTGSDLDLSVVPSIQHLRTKTDIQEGRNRRSSGYKEAEPRSSCSASADSVMEIQTHSES